ncbi:Hypothetical protein GLP15_5053 [Giardia lamblia P15]|uniref:Uncharacterized protein n=1 Tax=Giardia intestinalis (strain P15) TaxID=658858 RepID=E1EZJ1_GIAIA|nr:Hypothetical protein GLP15_5053 [Giardia lamblia P15]
MYSRVALWCRCSMARIARRGPRDPQLLEVLPRLLVEGAVSPEYDREGALPVCLYLGAVVRVHGRWLDHSYVDGLVGVGEEEARLLVRLVVLDPSFCSWITVHLFFDTVWSATQHEIASWRITLNRCVWLQLTMWSASILAPHSTHLELRTRSAETVGPSPHLSERRRKASSGSIRSDPKTWLMYEPVATFRSSRSATGSRCPVLTSRVSNASRSCLW